MADILENSPNFIQVLCGHKQIPGEEYVQISKESYEFSNSEEGFQWAISVVQEQVPNQMKVIAFSIIENYLINHFEILLDEQKLFLLNQVYVALASDINPLTYKLEAYIIYTLEPDLYNFFNTINIPTKVSRSLAFLEEFLSLIQNPTPRSADIIAYMTENEVFDAILIYLLSHFTPFSKKIYFVLKQIVEIYELTDKKEIWKYALQGLLQLDTMVDALELMAAIAKVTDNYKFVYKFLVSSDYYRFLQSYKNDEQIMYNFAVITHYQLKKGDYSTSEIFNNAKFILMNGPPMAGAAIVEDVRLELHESFADVVNLIFKYNCDEDYVNQEYIEYLLDKFVNKWENPYSEKYLKKLYEIQSVYMTEENQLAVALTFTEILERIHRDFPDSSYYSYFIEIFSDYFEIEPENSLLIHNSIFMNLVLIIHQPDAEIDLDFVFHQILKRIDAGQEEFISLLYNFIDKSLDSISFDIGLIENLLNSGNYQLQRCVGLLLNYVNDAKILYAIVEYIIQLDQTGVLLMECILGIRRENFSEDLINTLMTYLKSKTQEFKEDDVALSKFISVLFYISEENALDVIKEHSMLQVGPESLSTIIKIFKEKEIHNSEFFRMVFESFTDVFHNATKLIIVQEFKSFIENFLILVDVFILNIDVIPYEIRFKFFKFAIEAFQYARYLPNSLPKFTDFFMNYYDYIDPDQLNEIILHTWDIVKFIRISIDDLFALIRFHAFCIDHDYCGNDIFAGIPEIAQNEEIKNEYFGLIGLDPLTDSELFDDFLDRFYASIQ
ncbi:hypothetical protein TVAG_297130 [Trichomonas vaginalis G3]|uniref:Uncharacterized protein n=1 Tax=Trichomonas vaginalis (strain ATCC PRA-98 / G3) TaxID=412133 RepID=A2DRA8_TRIV3|nr:armadillo (ARM) repeat-containing protein family [Trichomonas vaginalis G3]EAY17034.1 hypothetical protein TVAG_297130 [Trichomonas vaginalis G3]KAI5517898.1 armadillo (ARM) repeat-containing protein family [Trichomonas vaginalis G3]|eukprot:XP_001329257.1 hypothetical protein [Trichomonas vaginalis G3]